MISESTTKILTGLDNELCNIYMSWKTYEELYGHTEDRVDLLNKAAPGAFRVIQKVLQDYIYLSIARILDPAGKGKNKNFTIYYLIESIEQDAAIDLANEVRQQCEEVETLASEIRRQRNKRIAHSDRVEIAKLERLVLGTDDLKEILTKLSGALNVVHLAVSESHFAHEFIQTAGDGQAIAYWLAQGLRLQDISRDFLRGRIDEKDFADLLVNKFPSVKH